jgi:hypothetical protein
MANKLKTTVVINDVHVGSNAGLRTIDEDLLKLSNAKLEKMVDENRLPEHKRNQIHMFKFWESISQKWTKPDKIILLGDLLDGIAYREKVSDSWTTTLTEQKEDFVKLIKMFGTTTYHVIRGTPYHTQTQGADFEELIAEELGVKKVRGQRSRQIEIINIAPEGGKPLYVHAAHHLNGSQWFQYRGTALARDFLALIANENHWIDREIGEKITGIVRAHNHYFWYFESGSRFGLQSPAWQLSTPFTRKVNPSIQPDIGAVRLIVNEEGEWKKEHILMPLEFMRLKAVS